MFKITSRRDDYLPGGIIQTTKPHTSWPWVNRAINCLIQKKSQFKNSQASDTIWISRKGTAKAE